MTDRNKDWCDQAARGLENILMTFKGMEWHDMAVRDLEHAAKNVTDGHYKHACFGAQHAAEKAVNAVYLRYHYEAFSSLTLMLEELDTVATAPPHELVNHGKLLDQYYIPNRYPNGSESSVPMNSYTQEQAADAVRRAKAIILWCEGLPCA